MTTPKKTTRSLTPAPNPAARMQELLRQSADVTTTEMESVVADTQVSKYLSKQSDDEVSEHASMLPLTDLHTGVITAPMNPSLHERVRERLGTKDGREATVRLSIDVSERMHERIKVYCAANRIPTTRALVVTLLEDLLDEAGY